MDQYLYSCQYCGKEYKPNRRHKQRFCSNSCRTNSFNLKKKINLLAKPQIEIETKKSTQIDKMSWAGIGNAAAGNLAISIATSLLTNEENKPATKKDLKNLIGNLNQRYHPIQNMPNKPDGSKAFYDLQTQSVVYLFNSIKYGAKQH